MSQNYSVTEALNDANPNSLPSALQVAQIGTSMKKIKATIAAMTASATPDLTAIDPLKITINAGPDDVVQSGVLPPIGHLLSLRVTASGTAGSVGPYVVTDAGGTAAIPPTATAYAGAALGLALIGDDQKTLTFPNTITGFVIEYFAAPGCQLGGGVWSLTDLNTSLAQPTGGVGI